MDANKIKALVIVVAALFFAVYLGVAAATAQFEALAWIVGALFLTVCFMLGKHVWILIPATLSMRGGLNLLPGQIPVWVFMTMAVAGFFALRVATRRQNITFRWSWMETAILLVGLTIFQAFARNPTGLQALGGDTAGGKPYFLFAFGFLAYYLIANSETNIKTWRWAIILYIAFGIMDGIISAISAVSMEFASVMIRIYSNVSFDAAYGMSGEYDMFERRLGFLGQIGGLLGLIACSFWRPLSAIDLTKPWRAATAGSAVILILLSGFRGTAASLFVRFCVGSIIRRHYLDVAVILLAGTLAISFLAVSGLSRSLPFGAQRVLTVIPIPMDLDPQAIMQADHSSEARFEMWRIALSEERYIYNKILGDGFQLSAREVTAMMEARMPGSRIQHMTFEERALEMGDFHGFHVETIRNTGVIGLIAATFALFVFAGYAWKAMQMFRGDPSWGFAIFVCMPVVIMPFWYWLVFGSYKADFPAVIAMAGMVKIAWLLGREKLAEARLPEVAEATAGQQVHGRPVPAFARAKAH